MLSLRLFRTSSLFFLGERSLVVGGVGRNENPWFVELECEEEEREEDERGKEVRDEKGVGEEGAWGDL